MSKIEVNAIEPQCGTTLTIGASDTSIAGIGTVNWDTTAKTTGFTAVSGRGYFVNTTSGAITVTMPATPSAGDIVAIKDYAGTFATNNVTLGRNGSNFDGGANDATLATDQLSVAFVYVDGTQGWKAVQSDDAGGYDAQFISATGGTITTCGNYKIHTFTSPGTFTVCSVGNPAGSTTVDYLVIAGGGGGGGGSNVSIYGGGGGGAGGYRESSGAASGCYTVSPLGACVSALPVSVTAYPITIGGGGTGASGVTPGTPASKKGSDGSPSSFSTITSTGGGVGGTRSTTTPAPTCAQTAVSKGYSGGSGGGSTQSNCFGFLGGSGNTPPVSPPQGNDGGKTQPTDAGSPGGTTCGPGGGGGATAAATSAPLPGTPTIGGNGGAGAISSINATPTQRAGGGGGGGTSPGGSGGTASGGGGAGGTHPGGCNARTDGTAGTANTGGGGGAGSGRSGTVPLGANGANGGSGIVIIRYKYQ